ncbi:LysR family transcriptional regulator [Peptacetobacter sp.]|uniref:LysR family transcriptional regulator n=1 Tax=Peptacetobacter sp. TaxID=2991975 RepID=UPI002611B812|nr:LysR family transcriptional regulator [Peptacetobacter sp.]
MKIEKLHYFESVARNKNFTKAAKECHIAQPAISHHIQNLEEELETDLFIRNSRNVSLTPQGEIFYKEVVKILKAYDDAVLKTKFSSMYSKGKLTIGMYGFSSLNILDSAVSTLKSKYPNVDIVFDRCHNAYYVDYLLSGKYDVILAYVSSTLELPDNIDSKLVRSCQFGIMIPKNHTLATKDSITMDDIVDAKEDVYVLDTYISYMKKNTNIAHTRIKSEDDMELLLITGSINKSIIFTTRHEADEFHNSSMIFREVSGNVISANQGIYYLKNHNNWVLTQLLNYL